MKFLKEVFLFGVSGVLGFIVDTAVLYALRSHLGLFGARLFSFVAAVFVTWAFNRRVTFSKRQSGLRRENEFLAYFVLMLGGGVVNYSLYAWLVVSYAVVVQYPVVGVAAGSLAGMLVNLATARLLLFRETTEG